MAYKTLKVNDDGTLSDASLNTVKRMNYGRTFNVCSPEFGADPTGVKDSTTAIQMAVDKAASMPGGGVVVIPGGEFRIAPPFVELKGYVAIRGEGIGSTHIFIDSSKINSSTVENGAFHTGTYDHAVLDKNRYRISIKDLSIHTTMPDGSILRGADGQYQHIGKEFMNSKAWGIVFNTYLGEGPADPDAVHTLKDIEIWDTAGGVALLGLDDQGCKISDIRVRRTMKQGLVVGKPFEHPEAYETNPNDASKPYRRTGAADNKFHRIDISGANQAAGNFEGIGVYTSQCMFTQCTSWYHQRHEAGNTVGANTPGVAPTGDEQSIWNLKANTESAIAGQVNLKTDSFRFTRGGAGWYVSGTRNEFSNCTSQETGGHGWVCIGALCTYDSCRGESPSYYGSVYTNAKTSEAAGFLVTNWSWGTKFSGCIVQNAYKREQAAYVGFYFQDYPSRLRVRDCVTQNMPFINGVDLSGGERDCVMPPNPGEEVVLEVNKQFLSTLDRDKKGGLAPAAAAVIPSEIGSVMAHWDFSDASKLTVSGGRVSAVAMESGSATDGTLVQADAAKQPWVTALGGRSAIKVKNAETDFLQAPSLGTAPIGGGWSVAMVVAMNSSINGQYLFSSIGAGAVKPASITITEMLGIRANSNGSSAGYTAKSPDKVLTKFVPSVIVMTANSAGVNVWVDSVKSSETPTSAGTTADLSGKATIGAYYGGTSGADASIGEVVAFSKELSDAEVAGLTAYLKSKWV